MVIRDAAPADIPRIIELGHRFFIEAGWSDVATWHAPSIADTLARMIESADAILMVAEVAGAVVGLAGAMAFPLYFNADETAAEELFWYVEPDHRSGVGGQMLDAMEAWAASVGALTFGMKTLDLVRPEAVSRLYVRRGYRATERAFIKRL